MDSDESRRSRTQSPPGFGTVEDDYEFPRRSRNSNRLPSTSFNLRDPRMRIIADEAGISRHRSLPVVSARSRSSSGSQSRPRSRAPSWASFCSITPNPRTLRKKRRKQTSCTPCSFLSRWFRLPITTPPSHHSTVVRSSYRLNAGDSDDFDADPSVKCSSSANCCNLSSIIFSVPSLLVALPLFLLLAVLLPVYLPLPVYYHPLPNPTLTTSTSGFYFAEIASDRLSFGDEVMYYFARGAVASFWSHDLVSSLDFGWVYDDGSEFSLVLSLGSDRVGSEERSYCLWKSSGGWASIVIDDYESSTTVLRLRQASSEYSTTSSSDCPPSGLSGLSSSTLRSDAQTISLRSESDPEQGFSSPFESFAPRSRNHLIWLPPESSESFNHSLSFFFIGTKPSVASYDDDGLSPASTTSGMWVGRCREKGDEEKNCSRGVVDVVVVPFDAVESVSSSGIETEVSKMCDACWDQSGGTDITFFAFGGNQYVLLRNGSVLEAETLALDVAKWKFVEIFGLALLVTLSSTSAVACLCALHLRSRILGLLNRLLHMTSTPFLRDAVPSTIRADSSGCWEKMWLFYSDVFTLHQSLDGLAEMFSEWRQYLPSYVFEEEENEPKESVSPPLSSIEHSLTPSQTAPASVFATNASLYEPEDSSDSATHSPKSPLPSTASRDSPSKFSNLFLNASPRSTATSLSHRSSISSCASLVSFPLCCICVALRYPPGALLSSGSRTHVLTLFGKLLRRVRVMVQQGCQSSLRGTVLDFDLHRILIVFGLPSNCRSRKKTSSRRASVASRSSSDVSVDPMEMATIGAHFALELRNRLDVHVRREAGGNDSPEGQFGVIEWSMAISLSECYVGNIGCQAGRRLTVVGNARSEAEFLAKWALEMFPRDSPDDDGDSSEEVVVFEGDHAPESSSPGSSVSSISIDDESGLLVCYESMMPYLSFEFFETRPLDIVLRPLFALPPLSKPATSTFSHSIAYEIIRSLDGPSGINTTTSAYVSSLREYHDAVRLLCDSRGNGLENSIRLIRRYLQTIRAGGAMGMMDGEAPDSAELEKLESRRECVQAKRFLDFAIFLWEDGNGFHDLLATHSKRIRDWADRSVISLVLKDL